MANMRPSWPLPKTPMTEPGIIGRKTDFTMGLNHASQPESKRAKLRLAPQFQQRQQSI
jgi:hypothetical protein